MGQPQARPESPPSGGLPRREDLLTVEMAATRKEKEKVYRFRYQIYVEEMRKVLTVVDHRRRLLRDDMDDWGDLFVVRAGEEIIGTVRLHIGTVAAFPGDISDAFVMDRFGEYPAGGQPGEMSFVSKAMVDPRYRGSQAFYLLNAAYYDALRRRNVQFHFCGGATHMVAMYEQLGYRRFKSNFPVPDYGYMVPMVMLTEDIEHFRRVRSPLWRNARRLDNSPAASAWFAARFPEAARYINRQLLSKEDILQMLGDKLGRPLHKAVHLFRGLNEAEALLCADAAHIVLCEAGDAVVNPTDICNEIFVIMSGVVSVRRQLPDRRSSVAILRPGQVYGDKAYLAHGRQNTTVVAQTDTELLVLPRHALERLETQHPAVAAKLLYNIGARTTRKYA
jgi:hypothetical protein